MIEQELLILGLLKEKPKHGYEIKKEIRQTFSLLAGVNVKSIYYPLRILERDGFVAKYTTREGRRPTRFVYSLTIKGQLRFRQLLTRSLLDFKRPQFSLDLSLYFLNHIKPEIARRRLRARTFILKKLTKDLWALIKTLKKSRPSALVPILEHNLHMVETESTFLSQYLKSLS